MKEILLILGGLIGGMVIAILINNGEPINVKIVPIEKPKYHKISDDTRIVCDDRGYAYYENGIPGRYTLTPILDNGIGNIQQVKCK